MPFSRTLVSAHFFSTLEIDNAKAEINIFETSSHGESHIFQPNLKVSSLNSILAHHARTLSKLQ